MKAYKGFRPDMTCDPTGSKPFQFAEGGEYSEPSAQVCERGFHATLMPIDVLGYYPPASSVYHEVEVDDDAQTHSQDSKVASKHIRIGVRLSIADLVKAQIEAVWSKCTVEPAASATGDLGAASATGNRGAASATGYQGAASATGHQGAASATGKDSTATACGWRGRAKGADGCALFLAERDDEMRIVAVKAVIVGKKSGGRIVKAETWYSLRAGKLVEVDSDGEVVR